LDQERTAVKLLGNFYQVAGVALTHRFDASAYLLAADDGLYLVDCGTPEGFELCLRNIRALGRDPANIRAIIGTHGHYDHVGAAGLFRERFGCRLLLHPADAEQVRCGDGIRTTASLLYGRTFPPCAVDGDLRDEARFALGDASLRVLHTPGHSPGSVSLQLETAGLSILIAGDTVYGGFSPRVGSDESAWKASLERLCAMHFDLLTFGHCSPELLADADRRLRSARDSFANYYDPWFKDFAREYPY
jgi:glyoxylase-like metal-dependent hydrolase (beta-lactamase superfamily II)